LAAAKSLAEALLAVQKAAPKLTKDGTNPHFKNEYVTLDALLGAILPVLHANDIVVMQWPTALSRTVEFGVQGPQAAQLGEVPALRTKLLHAPSGQSMEDTMPLTLDKATPQGQGSAITYARRYSLGSILGLITETDDDGNSASGSRAAKVPTEAELKKKTFAIAKAALEKDRPTVAEVAKFFGVQASDMQDKEVLQRLLEEHGAA
jgi:hypothetical protein